MRRVERHIFINNKELDLICFKSKNLYNYCNYILRQSYIQFHKLVVKEYELTKILAVEKQADYVALPAQTSQQVVKLLYKNWKSYFTSLKEYKSNPLKFKSKPKMPGYKHKIKGRNIVIFTNQNTKLKEGYIHFPKSTNLEPIKTKVESYQQVRIIPQSSCYVIEVVYEKEKKEVELNSNLYLGIDLGVNNLATCVINSGENRPLLINGKIIKSINQYYNKRKAELQSFIGDKGVSNKIRRLTLKRNNKINDYLHKTSRYIINYCIKHKIKNVIIGNNKDWKQNCNIGKVNNQNFIQIPFEKLISQLVYKGEEVGILVKIVEESYTSKIDHLVSEEMIHHEKYLGKRIKRGLFQSSSGKLINADVNGAIGILRKESGNSPSGITCRGFVFNPFKVTPLIKESIEIC